MIQLFLQVHPSQLRPWPGLHLNPSMTVVVRCDRSPGDLSGFSIHIHLDVGFEEEVAWGSVI